jgi:hypothetical protein
MGANGVTRQDQVLDPNDPRIAESINRHMEWLETKTPYMEELLKVIDRYLPGIAGFQLLVQVEVPLPFEQDNDGGGCN